MSEETTRESPAPGLRIVFSLLHAGYLRHYGEPIRILARRGHFVHIALYRYQPEDRDAALLHRLVDECPSVSFERSPRRRHTDGWRGLAWIVRGLVDVLRYGDARYDGSPALRERAAEKVRQRIAGSRTDPITQWVLDHALTWLSRRPSPERSRRLIRRLLLVEEAIPTSRRIDAVLTAFRADAVLASPVVEIGSPQVEFIKSARKLGIPSAVAVASWDNLSSKGLLRVLPDRVLVWNETQVRELEEMHGIPRERIVVTGGQKFDPWFERRPSTSRDEFASRVGLDPTRDFVLYLCSSAFIAPDEPGFVRRWLGALRRSDDPRVRELGAVIRPHPQNAGSWAKADLSDFENVAIWPRGGEHPDIGDAQAGFFDSMAHSVAVVGVNTSAQIDAAIVGKPVYTIRDSVFAASQDGTIHFRYLLEDHGGFVRSASSLEEHCEQLAAGFADPDATRARIDRFVESFVRPRGIDRPAAPIVAYEIEALTRVHAQACRQPTTRLLRALLTPVAAMLALAALPVAVRGRLRSPARRDGVVRTA